MYAKVWVVMVVRKEAKHPGLRVFQVAHDYGSTNRRCKYLNIIGAQRDVGGLSVAIN